MNEPADAMNSDQENPQLPETLQPDLVPPSPPPPQLPGPGVLSAVGWLVCVFVIQLAIGLVIGLVFGIAGLGSVVTGALQQPHLAFAFETSLLCLAMLIVIDRKYGLPASREFAIRLPRWSHLVLILALTLPIVCVFAECDSLVAACFRLMGLPENLTNFVAFQHLADETVARCGLWSGVTVLFVFGALIPAVSEELFFRGFLGRGLVARWGYVRGIALTSLLFGIMHLHPLHAVFAFLIGVVLHTVYLWTRSLVVPIVLHLANNSVAFLAYVYDRQGTTDQSTAAQLSLALSLTSFAAAAGVGWLLYQLRVRWVQPDGTAWSPGFRSAETPPPEAGAELTGASLRVGPMIVVAVLYLLFVVALGREMYR